MYGGSLVCMAIATCMYGGHWRVSSLYGHIATCMYVWGVSSLYGHSYMYMYVCMEGL